MIDRLIPSKQISLALASAFTVTLSLWGNAALAGDPFRTSNPRNIGDNTEAAFEAIFKEGNYPQAKVYLMAAELTEKQDPLPLAMRASLAYTEKDWETLNTYAGKTRQTAEQLVPNDPLRGNLYLAVAHFLEGAYTFKTEGGPLGAVNKLQKVFQYLEKAEKADPEDPEINLLKGYMELLLAVNLPFSSPTEAIERFEENAAPTYLVRRGIAVAYRDLENYDQALTYTEKALEMTPNNPELHYLKAQILYKLGKIGQKPELVREAIAHFDKALEKADQLPRGILRPITWEREQVQKWLEANQSSVSL
ncbi:MAG: Sll0314/Alr1548 family TPR repeat-containing protein [Halothece sp.]